MTTHNFLHRLAESRQGATIVEFALILPPLLLTLMGLFDMAHNMYTSQILNGAVQQAARNSTIQGTKSDRQALDAAVKKAVLAIAPGAKVTFSRTYFRDFSSVGRPEDWSDLNSNGKCDNGEPFEDVNGNSKWDKKPGLGGIGGARDAVLYKVSITYTRPFPVAALIPGQSKTMTMESITVLRNQPYSSGSQTAPSTGNCK